MSAKQIPLNEIVNGAQSAFVTAGVEFLMGVAIATPFLSWLSLPIFNQAFRAILKWVLGTLSEWAVMQAFFVHTTIRKGHQAQAFIDAVNAEKAASSPEGFRDAEQKKILAFRAFVSLSN